MENSTELLFPFKGIDVASEEQPPGTTEVGVNVRAFEALTGRMRGGSRPGLDRFIDEQVSGANAIQDINYVVRTDPLAVGEGGGFQPNQSRATPLYTINLIPTSATHLAGFGFQVLSATVVLISTGLPAVGVTLVLGTDPPGSPNDGDTGITDGLGQRSFSVSKPTPGTVVYTARIYNASNQVIGTSNESTVNYV